MFILQSAFCQQTVKMTTVYGTNNKEINELLFFQEIGIETVTFTSPSLVNKSYEIIIREYTGGKLANTKKLLDGFPADYLKIDSTSTSLKFYTQIKDSKLILQIRMPHFVTGKRTFNLLTKDDYIVKDFQADNKFVMVSLNDEFPVLAIITPADMGNEHSYCEVVQSEVAPENFGKIFNLPHYYIISMKFK